MPQMIELKDLKIEDLINECQDKKGDCSECQFSIKCFGELKVKCFFTGNAPALWAGHLKIEKI